ncbi:O-antigen ligase family protein [Selenihalanaerobacter shriftii]|nr:O-antigen ligase family protein [Selenihalanaerobacter shriftii]
MIILSTMYSAYPKVAVWGFPDRYEGMLVLLSYLVVMFLSINLINHERDMKFLLRVLFISASLISIIGLLQYLGFDIFANVIEKKLILPDTLSKLSNEINIKFDYIYSTLYNPNYVGSYMGMLFPLTVALYISIESKRDKIILGCLSLLIFSNWLGCLSRAGIIAGFGSNILLFLLLTKEKLMKSRLPILILGISFILVFTVMNYTGNGRLIRELLSFNKEIQKDTRSLENIVINKNRLLIVTDKDELLIKINSDNRLEFFNKDNKIINYNMEESNGKIKFKNKEYQNYRFKFIKSTNLLNFEYGKEKADFKIKTNHEKEFLILGFMGRGCKTDEVEKWGFTNHEGFASHRGYIWSRSIPLLKETFFTGYGPDLYALYFPQFDTVGKLINFGTTRIIVDKPHNMYLQIAINTGIISLITVLLMFGSYIYSSIKLYWNRNLNDFYSKTGVSIFVAIVAYLIAGLFNDSVISVAPVFWTLLGMGISINLKLKKGMKTR